MGNLTEKQEVSQKIKEFRAYLERLCDKEVDDKYFVIEGYKLKKTFIDMFGEEKPYEKGLQALEKEHRQDIKTIERVPRPYCHHCQKEVERYRVDVDEEIGALGGYRITAKCHGTLDTVTLSRWEIINDPYMKRVTMFKGGD